MLNGIQGDDVDVAEVIADKYCSLSRGLPFNIDANVKVFKDALGPFAGDLLHFRGVPGIGLRVVFEGPHFLGRLKRSKKGHDHAAKAAIEEIG